tara:strand:- start:1244 stop:1810 length:567 start_codon:yes stop_codon:yes gene_type:complete
MKLLKVKSNQDFIFKLVILTTLIMLIFFFIYVYNNLDDILPYREGMENDEDTNDIDKDEDLKKKKAKEETKENKNEKKNLKIIQDTIDKANMAMSYDNDNRAETLDSIDNCKKYIKAKIISSLQQFGSGTSDQKSLQPLFLFITIDNFINSKDMDNIISQFPLPESSGSDNSESNSSDSSSSSYGGLF